jgi:hypothetical protein
MENKVGNDLKEILHRDSSLVLPPRDDGRSLEIHLKLYLLPKHMKHSVNLPLLRRSAATCDYIFLPDRNR